MVIRLGQSAAADAMPRLGLRRDRMRKSEVWFHFLFMAWLPLSLGPDC